MKRALLVTCCLLGPAARVLAAQGPQTCLYLAEAVPRAGATIPANTPMLFFQPAVHDDISPGGEDVELREEGAAQPLPFTFEREQDVGWYLTDLKTNYSRARLLRLSRPLREGALTLSFSDDCGGTINTPLVPPVRDEHFRFQVGPAVPFPTHAGSAHVIVEEFVERSHCQQRRIWMEINLAPDLAAFPLIGMTATSEGRHLSQAFWRPKPNRIVGDVFGACGPGPVEAALSPGRHTVELVAEIAGGPKLPPLLLTLDVDCSADAGVCEDPGDAGVPPPDVAAPTPDAAVGPDLAVSPDAVAALDERPVPDAAIEAPSSPDAASALDERPAPDASIEAPAPPDVVTPQVVLEPDAAGAEAGATAVPADRGCDCATGGAPRGAPALGLVLVLGWRLASATRRRARASAGRRPTRTP